MKFAKFLLLATALCLALPAAAGPASDTLGNCLADNTSGRERKDLARWIFLAMAAHPEIRDLAAATTGPREDSSKATAGLFTRLLTESCPLQAKEAMRLEGSTAMVSAFGTLGKLAMQELMTNADVAASISGFERYVDRAKIEAVLGAK